MRRAGDSAGGNLSIGAALALRDAGEGDVVKALLLIYPVLDSRSSEVALERFGGPGSMLTGQELRHFRKNYADETNAIDKLLACPLRARPEGLPPVCLTISEQDVLTEQSLAMAERLRLARVPVSATVYTGATHSFIEAIPISALADRAMGDGASWLQEKLP